MYSSVGWPSLANCKLTYWYTFVYVTIFVLLPTYICGFIKRKSTEQSSLCSQDSIMLPAVKVRTEIERSFWFSAPLAWNLPQNTFKQQELVPLSDFKCKTKDLEEDSEMSVFLVYDNETAFVYVCMCVSFVLLLAILTRSPLKRLLTSVGLTWSNKELK